MLKKKVVVFVLFEWFLLVICCVIKYLVIYFIVLNGSGWGFSFNRRWGEREFIVVIKNCCEGDFC